MAISLATVGCLTAVTTGKLPLGRNQVRTDSTIRATTAARATDQADPSPAARPDRVASPDVSTDAAQAADSTPTAPSPSPPTPTPSATTAVVPASFTGTWSGQVQQPPGSGNGFPATITLTTGSTTGSFSLPTLRCQAILTLASVAPGSRRLTLDERVVTDPDGRCATSAVLVVTLASSTRLRLSWQDLRNPDNIAAGLLTRQ